VISFYFDASCIETAPTSTARMIAERWIAQDGICPICGKPMQAVSRLGKQNAASLDHVYPRCRRQHRRGAPRPAGLGHHNRSPVGRTVAAHGRCNSRKGDRQPTGCEIIWLLAVNARLGLDRPTTRWTPPAKENPMALESKLPAVVRFGDVFPVCPWCRSPDVGDATFTLNALAYAHDADVLNRQNVVDRDGVAEEAALKADCPSFGKPFAVQLRTYISDGNELQFGRLWPIRTDADLKLLRGAS